jgi:hypothetical protein
MKAGSPRATISAKYLPLLDAFRAKSDVRYYLDGIRIEPHETEDAYLVATNGLQLVVVHDAEAVVDEPFLIEPAATIARDSKKATKARFDGVTCELYDKLDVGGPETFIASAPAPSIDGKYPDWRSLMPEPSAVKSEPTTFDVKLLAALLKVPFETRYKGVQIHTRAPHMPAYFRFARSPEILVLIMPMRDETMNQLRPDWLPKHVVAKAA